MIKVQVQSFQMPKWVVPAMILIALALIPFALVLGLAAAALALGVGALRLFLPPSSRTFPAHRPSGGPSLGMGGDAIDVDYEVKDNKERHEKN